MATELSDRSLKVVILVLVVVFVMSVVVGLVLTRSPRLDPVPVPTVSQI